MRGYLVRRTIQMVILLLFTSILVYVILYLVPGGPFDTLRFANPRISPEHIKRLEALLGLDRPLHERYLRWLWNVLHGDWGTSWGVAVGQPVLKLIQQRLANTLLLMGLSTLLSLAIALPIGIYSAIRQYSALDYLLTAASFFGISMPTFWIGVMMLIVFAATLQWFPAGGASTPGKEADWLDRARYLVLPTVVLSVVNVAQWSRFIRSAMLDVLRQDYLRTARAKGAPERLVITKHALRNAMIPVITLVGLDIPQLFGGAIITESIFAWPGMGSLFYNAITQSDWPLVQAITMVSAFLVVASNLLADLLYALVDPRIRYD
jgi:peptide/nickel transport system permease protein